MLLWDRVITERADEIQGMSHAELGDLSASTIEGTIELFAVPYYEYFPPSLATVMASAVHRCRGSAPEWQLPREFLTHFADAVDAGLTVPLRPGSGPFIMAALTLVDGVTSQLDPPNAMSILSSCYTSIALSELSGSVTRDDERRNQQCQRALAMQQNLITQFSTWR